MGTAFAEKAKDVGEEINEIAQKKSREFAAEVGRIAKEGRYRYRQRHRSIV